LEVIIILNIYESIVRHELWPVFCRLLKCDLYLFGSAYLHWLMYDFYVNYYPGIADYFQSELEKPWYYEQPTNLQTGPVNLENLIRFSQRLLERSRIKLEELEAEKQQSDQDKPL